jgi:hypothetical protein
MVLPRKGIANDRPATEPAAAVRSQKGARSWRDKPQIDCALIKLLEPSMLMAVREEEE